MTDEEARQLKDGDLVVGWLYGRVRGVEIRLGPKGPLYDHLGNEVSEIVRIARGPGPIDEKGRRFGGRFRAEDVFKVDEFMGNIYADWLAENGHESAAIALREAFAMPDQVAAVLEGGR